MPVEPTPFCMLVQWCESRFSADFQFDHKFAEKWVMNRYPIRFAIATPCIHC